MNKQLHITARCLQTLFTGFLIITLCTWSQQTSAGFDFSDATKVTGNDVADRECFGNAVAISGSTSIVGSVTNDATGANNSEEGAAYIVQRSSDNSWDDIKKLNAGEGAQNRDDRYGRAVDIDGDNAIVGAWAANSQVGQGYIYSRNQGGANNWGLVATLSVTEGGNQFRHLGFSVSMDGDFVFLGAPNAVDDPDNATIFSGAVYIFERNAGGTNNWGFVKRLTANVPSSNAAFGTSVDADNGRLVVGEVEELGNSNNGAAYIFERNAGGTNNWGQVAKLTASDGAPGDSFALGVAIDGDYVVAGAPKHNGRAGAAYLYRNNGGWSQIKKLTASDAGADNWFGKSVDMIDGKIAIGAPAPDLGAGKAYVFEQNFGGFDQWGEALRLTADDGQIHESLGGSVALSSIAPNFVNLISGNSYWDESSSGTFKCNLAPTGGAAYVFTLPFTGPRANSDSYTATADQQLQVAAPGVLANDIDRGSGPSFFVTLVGDGSTLNNGSVNLLTNGSFVYTPPAGFIGLDRFIYSVRDGAGRVSNTTVAINVLPNTAPVAADDAYTTDENTVLNVVAPGVLTNDVDDNGQSLTAVIDSGPGQGQLVFNTNGSFTYTPDAGFSGTDSFSYFAHDGTDRSGNSATVTISDYATACGANNLPANTWRMVALPCVPPSMTVGDVWGDDLSGDVGTDWRLFSYDAINNQYQIKATDDAVVQGAGYWLRHTGGGSWSAIGTSTPVVPKSDNPLCPSNNGCFETSLSSPSEAVELFNMLGNPFPYAIDWSSVRLQVSETGLADVVYTPTEANNLNIMSNTRWTYPGTAYDACNDTSVMCTPSINTYAGFWIKLLPDAVDKTLKLLIPAQ